MLAFWFCADGTERALLNFCPLHGGALAGASSHGSGTDASHSLHHGASKAPHDGRTDHTRTGNCCDCIGSACCAAPADLGTPAVSPRLEIFVTVTATYRDESSHRPTAREHVLPPSIGPPST